MKTKGIARYGLVILGMLLAGVMFLPGRAMAPLSGEKIQKDLGEQRQREIEPRVANIRLRGTVTVPDGRKLNGVAVQLYEWIDGGRIQRFVQATTTNSAGVYSLGIDGQLLEKMVRVIPRYSDYRGGEHFSPQYYYFQITSANITNRDFRYEGPLPDLTLSPLVDPSGFKNRGGRCFFYFRVWNRFAGASGPFKVRVRVTDKGPDLTGNLESYKTAPVPSIARETCETVEVELGPGTAADQKECTTMCSRSGSGRYEIKSIRVDSENSVVERDEENNHFVYP